MYESISTLERLADEHRALIGVVRDIEQLASRLDGPCEDDVSHDLEQIVGALLAHLGCNLGATEELVYPLLVRELGGVEVEGITDDHREFHRCVANLKRGRNDLQVDAARHAADVQQELQAAVQVVQLHLHREELVYVHLLGERLRPAPCASGSTR